MLPETVDAPDIYRGDGWSWPVEFYADEDLTEPVDLTAYGAKWASQARVGGEVIDFDVDDTDAATGRIVLSLTHAQTQAIAFATLDYDLQATPTVGEPVTLIRGSIAVSGDETR